MQEIPLKQPFSNLQIELLKLYASGVSDEELLEIRDMIARFFAERAAKRAGEVWLEKGFDAEELLKEHRRIPYQRKPNQ